MIRYEFLFINLLKTFRDIPEGKGNGSTTICDKRE